MFVRIFYESYGFIPVLIYTACILCLSFFCIRFAVDSFFRDCNTIAFLFLSAGFILFMTIPLVVSSRPFKYEDLRVLSYLYEDSKHVLKGLSF